MINKKKSPNISRSKGKLSKGSELTSMLDDGKISSMDKFQDAANEELRGNFIHSKTKKLETPSKQKK